MNMKLTRSEDLFLDYLNMTLAPDLRESGREHTADDIETIVALIDKFIDGRKASYTDKEHVDYLKNTLIPDLKDSGMVETAKDLTKAVRIADKYWRS